MSESFWSLPDVTGVKTPHAILREQAEALTKQTNGRLEGWVENDHFHTMFDDFTRALRLSLRVPALDNYTYRLLEYLQPPELYPGRLQGDAVPVQIDVQNEQMFVEALRRALGSEETRRVVGALLSQANDAGA